MVLMGHSAGAGIVSQVAANPRFDVLAGPIRCVASLDTEAYDIAESAAGMSSQSILYQNAFRTDPAVWREVSPLTYARGGLPTFFVVTRGSADRIAMSPRFVDAL
jgi:arylformamidase